ncbi:MAG: cytochrome c1 [Betaproteobacteria bacterium]|nr:cytochrome c1 [Betaproteobacteria bacterium]
MKKLILALLFAPAMALASGAELHLDRWPGSVKDQAALQNGAELFVHYCLNCHGASYLRYNRLTEIGLTEEQIKEKLMYTAEKIGDPMRIAANAKDMRKWFGTAPPDLTVAARSHASGDGSGADWLYTYLRQFYPDASRPTGWNNVIFDNVGMPHVFWEEQGARPMTVTQVRSAVDANGKDAGYEEVVKVYDVQGNVTQTVKPLAGAQHEGIRHEFGAPVGGKLSAEAYDKQVSDLVAFMVWMGEPMQEQRKQLGIGILIFLAITFVFAYLLKKEYWKDIH